jgi:hypothetical protein
LPAPFIPSMITVRSFGSSLGAGAFLRHMHLQHKK